jgi:hypothetical protein
VLVGGGGKVLLVRMENIAFLNSGFNPFENLNSSLEQAKFDFKRHI